MKSLPAWGICLALVATTASADVRHVEGAAFTVESSTLSQASADQVFKALGKVGAWWDPAHTWSGDAKNLSLVPRAGGCFCERLAHGGSVEHARVILVEPGKVLKLSGALGPLQDMPVSGVLTFTLKPEGRGTRVTLTYRVAGGLTMDAAKLAPLVDQVLGTQLERLRSYSDR
jgi:uncharacterized protein YndB with AHSA1/START domain